MLRERERERERDQREAGVWRGAGAVGLATAGPTALASAPPEDEGGGEGGEEERSARPEFDRVKGRGGGRHAESMSTCCRRGQQAQPGPSAAQAFRLCGMLPPYPSAPPHPAIHLCDVQPPGVHQLLLNVQSYAHSLRAVEGSERTWQSRRRNSGHRACEQPEAGQAASLTSKRNQSHAHSLTQGRGPAGTHGPTHAALPLPHKHRSPCAAAA